MRAQMLEQNSAVHAGKPRKKSRRLLGATVLLFFIPKPCSTITTTSTRRTSFRMCTHAPGWPMPSPQCLGRPRTTQHCIGRHLAVAVSCSRHHTGNPCLAYSTTQRAHTHLCRQGTMRGQAGTRAKDRRVSCSARSRPASGIPPSRAPPPRWQGNTNAPPTMHVYIPCTLPVPWAVQCTAPTTGPRRQNYTVEIEHDLARCTAAGVWPTPS